MLFVDGPSRKDEEMKRRFLPVAAAALIAGGGVAGYTVNELTASSAPNVSAVAATANSGTAATTGASNVTTISSATSTSADVALEGAYDRASPSVVFVDAGDATGSGIIYDTNGNIVTNDHVVTGATGLSVTLNNGKSYKATVVGTDGADDLAVIHISASGLTPATFAKDGTFRPAQTVLAIGSPLGLKQTVTSGLISALNRTEQEPNGAYIPNALQTSAPINPGNSGGALVALDGSVVGMPTLEQTSDTSGTTAQDIGFAISAPRITLIADQLIASGKVEHTGRAYLGVSLGNGTTGSTGQSFGFGGGNTTTVQGATIGRVAAGSPAADAGLQAGDVITKFAGTRVTSSDDLLSALASQKPGSSVSVTIQSATGGSRTVTLHLSELPASA
jgi:S1-C subfamily serine protease